MYVWICRYIGRGRRRRGEVSAITSTKMDHMRRRELTLQTGCEWLTLGWQRTPIASTGVLEMVTKASSEAASLASNCCPVGILMLFSKTARDGATAGQEKRGTAI